MNIPKRIIIFRPGALGDTLVSAPVIWAFRKHFADREICYLSEEHTKSSIIQASEVAGLIPEIDETFRYTRTTEWKDRLRELRAKIKPRRGDVLVYLCYQRTSALDVLRDWIFFVLVGFRNFAGLGTALRDAARGQVPDSTETEYDRLFRMAGSLGIQRDQSARGTLRTDREWGAAFWARHKLNGIAVIVVCPGSKMQSKRWPAERFTQAISEISKSVQAAFIVIGDSNDHGIAEYIDQNATARVISAVGTTLLQSSTILSRAKLYLGNDTGPMHLAALHGVPCVAIFSSRDRDNKWHPWGSGHAVLRSKIECSGCLLEECFAAPSACLAKISVDSVVRAATERLLSS